MNATFNVYNEALPGEYAYQSAKSLGKLRTAYNNDAGIKIQVYAEGTNDLCFGNQTAAMVAALTESNVRALKVQSPNLKVVIEPIISHTGSSSSNGTCDALGQSYNSLVVAQFASYADGFVYGILEDSHLVGTGAYSNTTYFQSDGVHPTQAGQNLMAGYLQTQINNVIAGQQATNKVLDVARHGEAESQVIKCINALSSGLHPRTRCCAKSRVASGRGGPSYRPPRSGPGRIAHTSLRVFCSGSSTALFRDAAEICSPIRDASFSREDRAGEKPSDGAGSGYVHFAAAQSGSNSLRDSGGPA